jgi:hypothetical protein
MAGNATINVGNGTTIDGYIYGASDGRGTLNVVGNFTSNTYEIGTTQDAVIDSLNPTTGATGLEQINISEGNTFTLGKNATATRMNINGTVTAAGNITAAIRMGASGVLNLNTGDNEKGTSANVTGVIQSGSNSTAQGTLNINGTWTSGGVIGGDGRGLAAINLDTGLNATSNTVHAVIFAHSVNATTITLGTSTSQANATLQLDGTNGGNLGAGVNLEIGGDIVGGGNATASSSAAGGRLLVSSNTTTTGSLGTSGGRLSDIRIEDGTTLTLTGSGKNIYANNITMMSSMNMLTGSTNSTLAFNGTGTTNVYGIIAGGTEAQGVIDINAGTVTFNNSIGTNENYISNINVAVGSNMTTSSNIYAN